MYVMVGNRVVTDSKLEIECPGGDYSCVYLTSDTTTNIGSLSKQNPFFNLMLQNYIPSCVI